MTVKKKGVVHFHLDGMGDISEIVNKSGGHAYNVTSRELRYVYRNWARLKASVVFYNGFHPGSGGLQAVVVQAPW